MEATKSNSLYSPMLTSSARTRYPNPRLGFGSGFSGRARGRTLAAKRDRCDWDYSGRLVNGSMVVLRKRVHEMKMVERNYDPPTAWMDWEKQCYTDYDEWICRFIGFVQLSLMNTRPSIALAMFTLTLMSVPFSTVVVFSRVIEAANGALSTVHFY